MQQGPRLRRLGAAASLLLWTGLLTGCDSRPDRGVFEPVEGFAGLVAGDEPRAVTVGRDILGNGGAAADAAVAMYFVMTVTMPSRAGLAGGGVCVSFSADDSDDKRPGGNAFEFLPGPTASGGVVPRGARAMAGLHARQGIMRWEELVAPAENLARFGHAVSRAFARDIAAGAAIIAREPELRRSLSARAGELAGEGDRLVQAELSAVLGGIRQQGAGYLHVGPFAQRFAEASTAAGQPLSVAELRAGMPGVAPPIRLRSGKDYAYFPPPPVAGGLTTAQLWQVLREVVDYDGTAGETRAHLLLESAQRVYAEQAAYLTPGGAGRLSAAERIEEGHLKAVMKGVTADRHTPSASLSPAPIEIPSEPHSAGFVVADRWGDGVACSMTMNGLFGSGRLAAGTGILLPDRQTAGTTFLTPVVIGNENTGDFRLAATASGGLAAPVTLAALLMHVLAEKTPLQQAVAAPRLTHVGSPDLAWHEPSVSAAIIDGLARRGHTLRQAPSIGTIAAAYCPRGILNRDEECVTASDPRGFGLAYRAQ